MNMPPIPTEICSQCGMLHPKLQPGQICPAVPPKTQDGKSINLDKFFSMATSILKSSISKKNIKDNDRFVSYLIIGLTDLIEKYKEE